MVGDLRPGPNPNAIGLRDPTVLKQCASRRLLVGPDAFLKSATQLRMVRVADEVVSLVIESWIEEELLVLEFEVLFLFCDPALAQGYALLALGQRTHGYGPLFEGNRHC